jgi:hypothetical protein
MISDSKVMMFVHTTIIFIAQLQRHKWSMPDELIMHHFIAMDYGACLMSSLCIISLLGLSGTLSLSIVDYTQTTT